MSTGKHELKAMLKERTRKIADLQEQNKAMSDGMNTAIGVMEIMSTALESIAGGCDDAQNVANIAIATIEAKIDGHH